MGYTHLYSPGEGGHSPPGRGGTKAPPAPSPGREPTFPRPPPLPFDPGYSPLKKAFRGYFRLATMDPRRTTRRSRRAGAYLEQFVPEWYRKPGWYNYEGWKKSLSYTKTPARPGYYDMQNSGWTLFCSLSDGPFTAYAGQHPADGSACTASFFTVYDTPFGGAVDPLDTQMLLGTMNGSLTRMNRLQKWVRNVGNPDPVFVKPNPLIWTQVDADPFAGYDYGLALPIGFDSPIADALTKQAPAGGTKVLSNRTAPHLPPYSVPALNVHIGGKNGGINRAPPGAHNNTPPGPRNHEKKINFKGWPGSPTRIAGDIAGALSEAGDAANAISDAIDTGYGPNTGLREVKNPCKGLPLHKKVVCITANAHNIDWEKALWNLAKNHFEDKVIGKMAQKTTSNFSKKGLLIGNRGYNLSRYAGNQPTYGRPRKKGE